MPDREFRGILGIWRFPLINLLLNALQTRSQQGFANVEEWEVVEDNLGNLKKIIVHRRARRE